MQLSEELKRHLESLVHKSIHEWDELERFLNKKKIKKGDHFFQHFDRCEDIAIVSSGLFRIYLIDKEGEEKTFSFIQEKGFILDFFLTWEKAPSMVSCQALEDSEIYTINYEMFKEIMKNNSLWHEVYKEVLLRNYMSKTKREIEFVLHNAKERLRRSMKSKHLDVTRIPKTYLASYLGIAPPSLSRLFREMKEETA